VLVGQETDRTKRISLLESIYAYGATAPLQRDSGCEERRVRLALLGPLMRDKSVTATELAVAWR
jgi:hypothetical protein